VRASSLACKGEYAGVVIRRCGLGVIYVSESTFFTWSEAVPELLLHDIHELAGPMVCAPAAVRSFLHSSEEYTGDRASKSKVYDSQHTPLCSSDRDRRDTDVDVSENEILFLHYYHINQPSISKATAHFNTDRQTEVFVTGVKHYILIAATPFFIHLLYV
jgi:hypothetical protein